MIEEELSDPPGPPWARQLADAALWALVSALFLAALFLGSGGDGR